MILYVIFETARNGGLFCVQKNMREITGTGEFFERGSFRLNGKWEFLRIKKLLPMIATHYYQSLLTLSMHDHHYLAVLFGKL